MYLDRKPLAFFQLASSKADVYRSPYATKGFVQNVMLHNTGTSAETVTLYYDDGTSEHQWLSQSVAAKDSFTLSLPGEGFVVSPGAKITGNAGTAATVTCKLSGTEESEASVVGVESNLWCPPATPHVLDDEFDADTLSGWGVKNITDGVVGSFSYGTVDAYDTSFNSGNVVRVNANEAARRSWAQVQVPATGKAYSIYKSTALPTNLLVFARMKFNIRLGELSNDATLGLELVEATAGEPAYNSRVSILLNESDTTTQAQTQVQNSGGGFGSSVVSTNVDSQGQALEYVAIHKVGTTYHLWVGTASGNWIWMTSYGSLDFTPDMAVLVFTNSSITAPGVKVCSVDFVRFIETDNFLL